VPLLVSDLHRDKSHPLNPDRVESLADVEPAFEPLRYLHEQRESQNFLLNQERYRNASILLSGENVGTGSFTGAEVSLPALGIRVVIAPGFGPVFFSEAVRQGILLVPLTEEVIERIADWVEANARTEMTVDLETQVIEIPGMEPIGFAAHPRLRDRLLHGFDDLDELLQYRDEAVAFRTEDRNRRPWLYEGDGFRMTESPKLLEADLGPVGSLPLEGPLAERVKMVIDQDINPFAATHGGTIRLLEVRRNTVYIEMSGRCQGCGMALVTLRQGVERRLKQAVPEIESLVDVTDHTAGLNPYD
jgi:3-isopropylmalate/(R)-2-methylmalate dehydratase small subunit